MLPPWSLICTPYSPSGTSLPPPLIWTSSPSPAATRAQQPAHLYCTPLWKEPRASSSTSVPAPGPVFVLFLIILIFRAILKLNL